MDGQIFGRTSESQTSGWDNSSVSPEGSIFNATQLTYDWNSDNWLSNLQSMANKGDTGALEKLVNYYASEASSKTARDWTSQREDTQYQRLMDDLSKAGISPYVLSGATPGVSSSSGKSYSGSEMVSRKNNQNTNLKGILTVLGIIIGATIRAAAIAA